VILAAVTVHPDLASRFALLEGIASFEAAFADPAQRARLDEFFRVDGGPAPEVATREPAAPGPLDLPAEVVRG
jgi:hypothetical protein